MPQYLGIALSAVAAAVLVPIIMSKLSGARDEALQKDGYKIMEYSMGMKIAMYVCTVFFFGIAYLAGHFPGKTNPSDLPFIIAGFLVFGVFSLFTACLTHYSKVLWNQDLINGANLFGKRCTIDWSKISIVEDVSWAQGVKIADASGKSIWIYPAMRGFEQFNKRLMPELDRLDAALGISTKDFEAEDE